MSKQTIYHNKPSDEDEVLQVVTPQGQVLIYFTGDATHIVAQALKPGTYVFRSGFAEGTDQRTLFIRPKETGDLPT